MAEHLLLEGANAFQRNIFHQPGVHGIKHDHFVAQVERLVLALLERFGGQLAARQLGPCGRVEVRRTELREGSKFTVLSQVEAQASGHLAYGAGLSRTAHTRNRQTHIDGGADTHVKQLRLQVNLAVGDGDDVGRDISGNVAGLGLDDGQGRQRAAAQCVVKPGGAFEQAAVEIENISGIGLAAGRAA